MGANEDSRYMGLEPAPETAIRIGYTVGLLLLVMAVVAFIGELAGRWNDAGEVAMQVGATTGLLLTAGSYAFSASRRQVHEVGGTLASMDGKLDQLDRLDDLDVIQTQLDKQTGVMDRQVRILAEIRDRL